MSELWGDPEEYMTLEEIKEYTRRLDRERARDMLLRLLSEIVIALACVGTVLFIIIKGG